MADLAAFLAQAGRTPLVYGSHDCLLWLADWAWAVTGEDPAPELRGRYTNALACARYVAAVGSVALVVGRCAKRASFETIGASDLAPGAIGVAVMPTGRKPRQVGGLWTGRRWTFLTRAGLLAVPDALTIALWRPPSCLR